LTGGRLWAGAGLPHRVVFRRGPQTQLRNSGLSGGDCRIFGAPLPCCWPARGDRRPDRSGFARTGARRSLKSRVGRTTLDGRACRVPLGVIRLGSTPRRRLLFMSSGSPFPATGCSALGIRIIRSFAAWRLFPDTRPRHAIALATRMLATPSAPPVTVGRRQCGVTFWLKTIRKNYSAREGSWAVQHGSTYA